MEVSEVEYAISKHAKDNPGHPVVVTRIRAMCRQADCDFVIEPDDPTVMPAVMADGLRLEAKVNRRDAT